MKNELIFFRSTSLGDIIAWMPIVEEYRKKTGNKIFCISNFNDIFNYPFINFINQNQATNEIFDKIYEMGFFIENLNFKKMNLKDPRTLNLQEIACDILKIAYNKQIKPNIFIKNSTNQFKKKYVCIAVHSTFQGKYWNHKDGWEKIISYLNEKDYDVVCIDKHKNFGNLVYENTIPKNSLDYTGLDIHKTINIIHNCEFFIGLSSGLSWLAWALNKKTILISGFTDPKTEFYTPYRVIDRNVCNSCFNDTNYIFNKKDFLYCPKHKNTEKMFECTKFITPNIIIEKINKILRSS